jgi:hypothetical protein
MKATGDEMDYTLKKYSELLEAIGRGDYRLDKKDNIIAVPFLCLLGRCNKLFSR